MDQTQPNGRVLGIDIIAAQPPKGVSTVQGNFLSGNVQSELKRLLCDQNRGRMKRLISPSEGRDMGNVTGKGLEVQSTSYLEAEKKATNDAPTSLVSTYALGKNLVDVMLSDMCGHFTQNVDP